MTDQSRDSDYAHLTPLFAELAALPPDHPDRAALRNKLVTGYLPVVQHIARRFAGRGEPVDDLEQAGTVGLLNAVDRFEPDRGIDFLSSAVPPITRTFIPSSAAAFNTKSIPFQSAIDPA